MIAEALAALALLAAPPGPARLPGPVPATLAVDPAALPGGPFEVLVQHDPAPLDMLLVALSHDHDTRPVAVSLVLRPAFDAEDEVFRDDPEAVLAELRAVELDGHSHREVAPVAALGLPGHLSAWRVEDRFDLSLTLYSPGRAADLFVTTTDPDLSRAALVAAVDQLLRAALVPD